MLIDPLRCYMAISSDGREIRYCGEAPVGIEAVIPRIGVSHTAYGTAVVRQFEAMSVYTANSAEAIARSRDKIAAYQILADAGIAIPVTGFAHDTAYTDDLIRLGDGPPLIVKLVEGTQGIGVVLTETRQAAQSVIEAFRGLKANILVQEYIEEAAGDDIRSVVVGGKVVASMRRSSAPGEFRANLHRGGKATRVTLTPAEERNAIRAAEALELRIAGVDQLRSRRGPLVLEVNSSPGLEGIESASGVDVAKAIISFIESEVEG